MTTLDEDPTQALHRLHDLEPGSGEYDRVREDVIRGQERLVQALAARFSGRGETMEDLCQVGMVGLIKSVDRFNPDRGTPFVSYAVPTIVGEIKRHFRDRGWAIRPPRRMQELRAEARGVRASLTQTLGRSPTMAEVAAELGCEEEVLTEAIVAGDAYNTSSLDRRYGDDPEEPSLGETLGCDDDSLDFVELREAVRPAMERLPDRERKILLLRFYGNKTQREIADEFGISQMHVSRLISQSIARLRADVLNG